MRINIGQGLEVWDVTAFERVVIRTVSMVHGSTYLVCVAVKLWRSRETYRYQSAHPSAAQDREEQWVLGQHESGPGTTCLARFREASCVVNNSARERR